MWQFCNPEAVGQRGPAPDREAIRREMLAITQAGWRPALHVRWLLNPLPDGDRSHAYSIGARVSAAGGVVVDSHHDPSRDAA